MTYNRRLVPMEQMLSPEDLGDDVLELRGCVFEHSKPLDHRNTHWIYLWKHEASGELVALVEEPSVSVEFIEFPETLEDLEEAICEHYDIYDAEELLRELADQPGDIPNQFELLALLVLASDQRSTTPEIVAKVASYFGHPEFDLRYLAFYSLGFIRDPLLFDAVVEHMKIEEDERIRALGERMTKTDTIPLWDSNR